MKPKNKRRVHVLSSRDTQGWHSPFSRELRRWRQSRIVENCIRIARDNGFSEFAIYDAYENYLTGGVISP